MEKTAIKIDRKEEPYVNEKFNIFSFDEEAAKKDDKLVDTFVFVLRTEGIPIKNIKTISDNKNIFDVHTYSIPQICYKKNDDALLYAKEIDYAGTGGYIGRTFDLRFGNCTLEFSRKTGEFGFDFSYEADNEISRLILHRLKLSNPISSSYNVEIYPVQVKDIVKFDEKLQTIERKLNLKGKINDYLDGLLAR